MAKKSEDKQDVTKGVVDTSDSGAAAVGGEEKGAKKTARPARPKSAKPAPTAEPSREDAAAMAAHNAAAAKGQPQPAATAAASASRAEASDAAKAGPGEPSGPDLSPGASPITDAGPITDAEPTAGADPIMDAEPEFITAPDFAAQEGGTGHGAGAAYHKVRARLKSLRPEGFYVALGFLSRLGPARERSEEDLRGAVPFYPLVGLLLGLLALLPVWLIPAGYFWLKAWTFSMMMLWLTRGLHWDGLADLADALGSGRSGEAFQDVLKDSRSGVFAIVAVVFCALGYVVAAQALLVRESWLPFVLAPALARCVPLYIGSLSQPNAVSHLGKILRQAVDLKLSVAWTCALALAAVLTGHILAALLALIIAGLLLYYLLNLAEREGGYNGDFMGAGIMLVELGVLLAFVLG